MISNRPMIPMLTHVDNLGDLNLDMTSQEQLLQQIEDHTNGTNVNLTDIRAVLSRVERSAFSIETDTSSVKTSSSNTATAVGTTEDADTATTVIGLLKSIVNKLS